MVFNKVLELSGICKNIIERKETFRLWRIWLLLGPLAKRKQSEAVTTLLDWELQGVNQAGFTKYLCQAFIWSFHPSSLPPLPTPFVNVNHFLISLEWWISHLSFLCEETWVLMVQDWVPLYVSSCLLVNLRDACGKKVGEGEEIWEKRLRNRFKLVSFSKWVFVLLATFRCVFGKQ